MCEICQNGKYDIVFICQNDKIMMYGSQTVKKRQ